MAWVSHLGVGFLGDYCFGRSVLQKLITGKAIFMHVEVNETNIAVFDLARLTGNSREDLLDAAAKASADGYVLSCRIPDPDDKLEVNAFEHFESEKAPSVSDLVNTYSYQCRYEEKWTDEVGDVWVCIIHHTNSRHVVTSSDAKLPCLFLDPYPMED